jgi:ubiquitin-protein ligase
MMACVNRVKKELDMLANDPGPGISAWPISDDNIMVLQVTTSYYYYYDINGVKRNRIL